MRTFAATLLLIVLSSCNMFEEQPTGTPIARVNQSYLYKVDVANLVAENTSKEDSALIVSNYINRWATQQLLLDKSKINLPQDQLTEYERLVNEYKKGLYTEAYKNIIVSQQLDSAVSNASMIEFYNNNSENFRLNDELYKVRYVTLDKDFLDVGEIRDALQRFNQKDRDKLNTLNIQFKNYNFNDSVWMKKERLVEDIPVLITNAQTELKKSGYVQLQDSLGVYLLKIQDVLQTGDIAPLSYIKPTLKQIVLNKRKLELIKKLETDITKDAIKNDEFEIYK